MAIYIVVEEILGPSIVTEETNIVLVYDGEMGVQGPPGNDGTDGQDGTDGLSAYEVAVENGFVGTESEWLDSLVGPAGPQGENGATGSTGATGATGPAGANGSNGIDGEDGLSAYEIAVANGFVGTESEWIDSLESAAAAALASANSYTDTEISTIIPYDVLALQGLGSEIKVFPMRGKISDITTSYSLTNQQATYLAFYNEKPRTITGIEFWQNANGVFTPSNFNGFAIYSHAAGVLTKVAETTNNGTLWTSGATTNRKEPLTTPYAMGVGIFYVFMVRNSTAAGTAPTVAGFAAMTNANMQFDFTNNGMFCGIASGVTALPASLNLSSLTRVNTGPALFLY